jgi:hypothetical protein
MKIILDIRIVIKGKHIYSTLRKEYESNFYPGPGIEIEDSAWEEPKVPTRFICNFQEGYYLLNFRNIELDTEENCKREEEMYVGHGWKNQTSQSSGF